MERINNRTKQILPFVQWPVKSIDFEVFNKFDDFDSFPDLRGSTQGNLK